MKLLDDDFLSVFDDEALRGMVDLQPVQLIAQVVRLGGAGNHGDTYRFLIGQRIDTKVADGDFVGSGGTRERDFVLSEVAVSDIEIERGILTYRNGCIKHRLGGLQPLQFYADGFTRLAFGMKAQLVVTIGEL